MKKIYLFLLLFTATTLNAQVAFLKVSDSYPDYGGEQPEQNAYDWFVATYGDGNVVDMNHIPTDASTYKVLWVNVERDISEADFDNLFPADKRTALSDYVKAGGNLLLTKKASRLACHIGRMGDRVGGMYYPSWGNSVYNVGGDIWTINAMIGVRDGLALRDARQHPIFKDMTRGLYNEFSHESFPLIGKVNRSDNNIMWTEMERKDGAARADNDNLYHLQEFESSWNCQVLAVWGQVVNYCAPTVIEFFPLGEYKGSVITIGAAAYQWGSSNDYISNVQKLTQNALTYLSQGGVEYGYYLPYSLSEIYSIDEYQPEYQPAKWFYDNYVVPGNGRFIHKDEVFPTGMKVLWVHGDRVGQNAGDFYNAFGGDAFKTKLQAFVQAGGKVFLTKQANRFVNDIGRCTWVPSYDQSGYNDGNDTWYMVSNFVPIGVDRHNHPAFRYMENYTEHVPEGYCKWPLVNGDGTYKRSDHKYMWGEPGDVWSNIYGIYAGATDIARLNAFESVQNCQILGGWGHTTALDGVTMVEFLPTASFAGTVIAQGVPAYQWTTPNTAIYNVKNLTQGVLEYLSSADIYTRDVPADHYGTICLPRASASLSDGMKVYRVLSDETDGIMLEEVNAMEAGVPYFFYSTATQISVTMTGAAVLTPQNGNGLIGNFGPASVEIPNDPDNYILGSDNTLYYIDQAGIMLGANRAYLDRSTINQSTPSGMPKRVMGIHKAPSVATALDNTGSQNILPVKKLINGRLVIQVGDQLYDVTGTQVK